MFVLLHWPPKAFEGECEGKVLSARSWQAKTAYKSSECAMRVSTARGQLILKLGLFKKGWAVLWWAFAGKLLVIWAILA